MRFSIVFVLAFLAASTNAIQLNQDQVSASRRYLAALEPSLAVAGTLQEEGVDVDAMTKCFQDLHAKGLTMTKKEDRVTITQQCVFSASLNGKGGGNFDKGAGDAGKGKGGAGAGKGKGGGNPKGRDPRAIPVDQFARLTLSGQPNADLCTRNTKLQKHDGTQQPDRCVAVDLGEIPAEDKCPSQLFVAPRNGATLRANKAIQFKVAVNNLDTGFFSDPAIEYYKFPQMLNKQGVIMGHSHITIQDIGNGKFPPSPQQFAKFQGLNDAAKNNVFTLDVPEGLPTGNYRACTISGSFAHTPVLCPKAQRGAQEDCIRFNVK